MRLDRTHSAAKNGGEPILRRTRFDYLAPRLLLRLCLVAAVRVWGGWRMRRAIVFFERPHDELDNLEPRMTVILLQRIRKKLLHDFVRREIKKFRVMLMISHQLIDGYT
jgi:hypothetical protein